jgi:hypothetical protein
MTDPYLTDPYLTDPYLTDPYLTDPYPALLASPFQPPPRVLPSTGQ